MHSFNSVICIDMKTVAGITFPCIHARCRDIVKLCVCVLRLPSGTAGTAVLLGVALILATHYNTSNAHPGRACAEADEKAPWLWWCHALSEGVGCSSGRASAAD